jgi:formylglycine-generating enzyme required for sulfatase activity
VVLAALVCALTVPATLGCEIIAGLRDRRLRDDAGAFSDGAAQRDAGTATCPPAMVLIDQAGVCMDRWEASRRDGGVAAAELGAIPWTNVAWAEAVAACAAAGKRLCTFLEWAAGCAGPAPGTTYSWGNVASPTACNVQEAGRGAVAACGEFAGCEGGYPGLFDMSGNVAEWTSTVQDGVSCRIGARWWEVNAVLQACLDTSYFAITDTSPGVGFRCCRDLVVPDGGVRDAAVDAANPCEQSLSSGCPDDMVFVPPAAVCIDRYEASAADGGVVAVSKPGVLPWRMVGYQEASAACTLAGKRLCTSPEWQAACGGPGAGTAFPYGDAYRGDACYGPDYPISKELRVTGFAMGCEGFYCGLFDMSGSVYEYVAPCAEPFFDCPVRGGSFFGTTSDGASLRCDAWATTDTLAAPERDLVGFRCCRDLGQVDAGVVDAAGPGG